MTRGEDPAGRPPAGIHFPAAPASTSPTGQLSLRIEARGARSVASEQFHRGALRVLRPHYLDEDNQVTYTLVNPGGGYLGGDHYAIATRVEPRAAIRLITQSATKVYRCPQQPAVQTMQVEVGPEATFEYLPHQLIVYRDGAYRQHAVFRVHPTAHLASAEICTPGWSPTGEPFAFRELRTRTEIRCGERLVAVDALRLVPSEIGASAIAGIGMFEGRTHMGQLMLTGPGVTAELADEASRHIEAAAAQGVRAGVSRLDAAGVRCLAVRSLGVSTDAIDALHLGIVGAWRAGRGLGAPRRRG